MTVRSTVTISVVVLVAPPGNATVTVCVLAYVVANTVCTLVLGAKVSETVTTGTLPVRVTSPKGAETRTVEPPMYEVKVASEGGAPAAAVSSTLIWITVVEGSGIKIEEMMDWDVTVDMAAGEMSARRAGGIVFLKAPLVTYLWLRLLLAPHSTWCCHHLESPVQHRVPRRGRSARGAG